MPKKDFSEFLQNPENFSDFEPKSDPLPQGKPVNITPSQPSFTVLSLKLLFSTGVLRYFVFLSF